jgi:hypothetical protein
VYQLTEHEFILFDCYRFSNASWHKMSNGGWQETDFLEELANVFKIRRSPCIAVMTLVYCIKKFFIGDLFDGYKLSSLFQDKPSEGFILRPECQLTTSQNERVITKLKFRDKFSKGFELWP